MVIRETFLSDVDGCVAGLMEGFSAWCQRRWGRYKLTPVLPVEEIVYHSSMGQSPGLQDFREFLKTEYQEDERHTSIGKAFVEFMNIPTVYEDWVPVIPGSIEAIGRISRRYDPVFVTAIMKDAPTSYASKFRWLQRYFRGIPVTAIPSDRKHDFRGKFAVDDRWDICERWASAGTVQRSFCLGRPWSEAPRNVPLYTWDVIVGTVERTDFNGEF